MSFYQDLSITKKRNFPYFGLIILLNLLAFFPFLADPPYFSGHDFEWLWSYGENWPFLQRPISHLFFHFCLPLFKLNPLGYHLTGFIIHLLNALLIYGLVKLITQKRIIALISSLFFSWHYTHAEVTLGILHIGDLIAVLFYLLAVITFIKFINSTLRCKKITFYFISIISFTFGLLSNELLVSLPLLLFIYKFLVMKKRTLLKALIKSVNIVIPYLLIGVIWILICAFPFIGLRVDDTLVNLNNLKLLTLHPINTLLDLTTTIKLLFIPFNFQGQNDISFWKGDTQSIFIAFIILFWFGLLIFWIKNIPYRFSLFWILITALMGLSGRAEVAEKYLYLPLIGTCFLMSLLIQDGLNKFNIKKKSKTIFNMIKIFLIILILSSHYFSFQQRILARREMGKIIHQGLSKIKQSLSSAPLYMVSYFLGFPEFIYRFQAFPPYSMDRALDEFFLEKKNVENWLFVDYPIEFYSLSLKELTRTLYLITMCAPNKYIESEDPYEYPIHDDCILKGIDSYIPQKFKRYLFIYYNKKLYNLTDKIFAKTKASFEIKVPNVRSIAIIGDFNHWDKSKNYFSLGEDGIWRSSLLLPPGKYAYKLVINGKEWLNNPNSKYYLYHPLHGRCSYLIIPNYILPMGLLPSGDAKFDQKIIELKKRTMLHPEDKAAHRELSSLFYEKGFNQEAWIEQMEALGVSY